jgi:hypothetical protein
MKRERIFPASASSRLSPRSPVKVRSFQTPLPPYKVFMNSCRTAWVRQWGWVPASRRVCLLASVGLPCDGVLGRRRGGNLSALTTICEFANYSFQSRGLTKPWFSLAPLRKRFRFHLHPHYGPHYADLVAFLAALLVPPRLGCGPLPRPLFPPDPRRIHHGVVPARWCPLLRRSLRRAHSHAGACRASLAASVIHFMLRGAVEAPLEVDGVSPGCEERGKVDGASPHPRPGQDGSNAAARPAEPAG